MTPFGLLCSGISLHSSSSSKRKDRRTHDLGRTDVNRRTGWRIMYIQRRHWLDYDPVAVAVLVIGIGTIELLAMII